MRDHVQPAFPLALEPHSQHDLAMRPSTAVESHRQAIVQIDPTSETTLFDIGAIWRELKCLLGIEVDVLTPNALPDSFRNQVLAEAKRI